MKQTMKTKNLIISALFTAIICVLAQISIPTWPIPFTLALFAIFLTGAILPPRYALMSVLTYLLLGAFGVPVFAGFRGGLQALIGPTGGYLVAYPIMAFVIAMFNKYFIKVKMLFLVIGMLVSLIICYVLGTAWFTFSTDNSFYQALTLCVFPFILFDCLKIVLAVLFTGILKKTLSGTGLLEFKG